MSQWTRQLQPEDVAEPREPHVVQLIGPYSRVWKVQVVLMTLLELDSPLPRCRTGESRMQEVILRDQSGTVPPHPCGAPRERRCPYP